MAAHQPDRATPSATRPRTFTDMDIEDILTQAEPLLAEVDEGLRIMRAGLARMDQTIAQTGRNR